MSLRHTLAGGTTLRAILGSRFGHFASTPVAAAPAAEDEDDEAKRAAKKAEEDEAKRKAEEEEEARRSRRARKGRRAKSRERDDDDDEDDDADDAGNDDEDDDDEDEMKKAASAGHTVALDAAFRTGARAQRRRCAAIFAHKAAAANPILAMSLAFETSMTAGAAIRVLENTPAPRTASLHDRMNGSGAAGVRVPPSAPGAPSGPAAIAMGWDGIMAKVAPVQR